MTVKHKHEIRPYKIRINLNHCISNMVRVFARNLSFSTHYYESIKSLTIHKNVFSNFAFVACNWCQN